MSSSFKFKRVSACPIEDFDIFWDEARRRYWCYDEDRTYFVLTPQRTIACVFDYSGQYLNFFTCDGDPGAYVAEFLLERRPRRTGLLARVPHDVARCPVPPPGWISRTTPSDTWMYLPRAPAPRRKAVQPVRTAYVPLLAATITMGYDKWTPQQELWVSLSVSLYRDRLEFHFEPRGLARIVIEGDDDYTRHWDDLRLEMRMPGTLHSRDLFGGVGVRLNKMCQYMFEIKYAVHNDTVGCSVLELTSGSIVRRPRPWQRMFSNEADALYAALAASATAADHAARVIQRAWRLAISCTGYSLCRARLHREFSEMSQV